MNRSGDQKNVRHNLGKRRNFAKLNFGEHVYMETRKKTQIILVRKQGIMPPPSQTIFDTLVFSSDSHHLSSESHHLNPNNICEYSLKFSPI